MDLGKIWEMLQGFLQTENAEIEGEDVNCRG